MSKSTETSKGKTNISKTRPFLALRGKSKIWKILYVDKKTGKRVQKSTGTEDKSEAETILREFESAVGLISKSSSESERIKNIILEGAERTAGIVVQRKTPLEDIWKEYEKNERTRALKALTRRNYKIILEVFLEYVRELGIEYTEQINYEICKGYMSSLRDANKSDGTITNIKNALGGIFKRVKRPLGLHENPFEDIEAPFRPKRKHP